MVPDRFWTNCFLCGGVAFVVFVIVEVIVIWWAWYNYSKLAAFRDLLRPTVARDAEGKVRFYCDAAAEAAPLAGGGMSPPFM